MKDEHDELDAELRDLIDEAHGGPGRFWRGLAVAVIACVGLYVVVAVVVLALVTPSAP